jgi:Prenyltransferase and squalene oxidase repeat
MATTTPDLGRATDFMWRTARLLERRRYAYLFLDGERQAVPEALRPYQNSDGGFGNGLEPDVRAPVSQPVPTWTALGILDETGDFTDPMVGQICDYLLSITTAEGGVPFVLPSVRDYPRAPWWEADDQPSASLNPTAAIAGLLYKHGVQHPWLVKAATYSWSQLDALDQTSPYEIRAVFPFLDHVPDRRRAEEVFDRIGPKILEQNLVALTPTAENDTHTPLNYAPRPESMARRLFSDEVIEANLDALASAQQEDGGWPFNWLAWNAATALEWRGVVTIEALVTLRAYGREV